MANGEEAVRRLATWILGVIRQKDLPSIRSELQSYTDNHSGALASPKYIVQEPSSLLTNEQALSSLATGYMKVTTTTGVVSSQAVPIPPTDGGTGVNNASRTLTISTNGGTLAFGAASKILTINASLGLGGTDNKTLTLNGDLTVSANLSLAGTAGKTLTLTGALTVGADTSITGGGTLALGGFTLTVPATGTAALGTGSASQIAYWSGTNTLTSESIFVWDASNNRLGVGIGTPNSASIAHFDKDTNGSVNMFVTNANAGGSANVGVRIGLDPADFVNNYVVLGILGTGFTTSGILIAKTSLIEANAGERMVISNFANEEIIIALNSRSEKARFNPSGAVLIGRTTGLNGAGDLDVNGNFRAHGSSASGAQSADMGALAGAAVGWETNAQTNINAIRTCLRDHGLMA